jgi:hypothetical protein
MLINFIRKRGWAFALALAFGCGKGPNDGRSASSMASTGAGGTQSSGTSGTTTGGAGGPLGDPGCGLQAAAFCDNFNAPSSMSGRAGELDVHYWAAGRLAPQLPTAHGVAIGIGPAVLPNCRAGLPANVLPDQDTLICDPSADVGSNHLLVAAAAQNYGENSYRIRQPFDFGGRTGKIVFSAEGYVEKALYGWVSVDVTEDPINAPSFAVGGVMNDEGSLLPRNGFEVQFQDPCSGRMPSPSFGVRMIDVFQNYTDKPMMPTSLVCVAAQKGKLNHFEISVSQQRIDVYATPFSADGTHFGAPVLLYGIDVNLPFSRGYVHITVHNHATLKYSANLLSEWVARWDDVGFDGPIISNWREYEVPDALAPGMDAWNRPGPVVSVGYAVADAAKGPSATFHLRGVDLSQVAAARLSVSSWYLVEQATALPSYVLRYRFNGKAWHDRPLTPDEIAQLSGPVTQGQLGQMIDVPLSDLVQGDNTLEFVTANVPQNYPPAVANVDLVLTTN